MTTAGSTSGLRGNAPSYEYITTKQPVIYGSGATRSLIDSESGSNVLFDRAAGTIFTLPVALPGMTFTFLTNVLSTANAIVTNIGTSTPVIIGGLISTSALALSAGSMYTSNGGNKNVRIAMNGTTTGGIEGSKIVLTALSSGTWFVSGTLISSGANITPFSAYSA